MNRTTQQSSPTTRTLKLYGWVPGYVKHPGKPQLHNRKTGCYIIGASVKLVQRRCRRHVVNVVAATYAHISTIR